MACKTKYNGESELRALRGIRLAVPLQRDVNVYNCVCVCVCENDECVQSLRQHLVDIMHSLAPFPNLNHHNHMPILTLTLTQF